MKLMKSCGVSDDAALVLLDVVEEVDEVEELPFVEFEAFSALAKDEMVLITRVFGSTLNVYAENGRGNLCPCRICRDFAPNLRVGLLTCPHFVARRKNPHPSCGN
jgi:hypothetical protein